MKRRDRDRSSRRAAESRRARDSSSSPERESEKSEKSVSKYSHRSSRGSEKNDRSPARPRKSRKSPEDKRPPPKSARLIDEISRELLSEKRKRQVIRSPLQVEPGKWSIKKNGNLDLISRK